MTSCKKISPKTISREEILLRSDDDRRDYFEAVRINHPRIRRALDEIEMMALANSGTDIALFLGPTGVGKTALVQALSERYLERHREEMLSDPGFIPILTMEAPASGELRFSWRMFYTVMGNALPEPLMDRKQESPMGGGHRCIKQVNNGTTVGGMRSAIENVLRHRRIMLVVIDEAAHMFRHAKGDVLSAAMDALKSLGNLTGVTLILVGSYDLYPLVELSAQLSRRSAIVHFRRYEMGIAEDEDAFKKVLGRLQSYLPVAIVPDLSPFALDLQLACIGCVGILKTTLARALNFALSEGEWNNRHLEHALLTEVQMKTILKEILEGEAKIAKNMYGATSFEGTSKLFAKVQQEALGSSRVAR